MNLKASDLALIFVMVVIPAVGRAQDFSADVVYGAAKQAGEPAGNSSAPHHPSRLYVSKDNIRLETNNLSGTVLLVNGEQHAVYALYPARKEYQELPGGPSEYFRVDDAENACPNWQKASIQKVSCEKVGNETVNGRAVVKYRNQTVTDTSVSAVWVDKALKFVIKWESGDTVAELRNITEGSQPANLFVVPTQYGAVKAPKANSKGFSPRPR